MKFEILLSVYKVQRADLEFDSKEFQIKKDCNSSSDAILQETVLVQCRSILHRVGTHS